MKLNKRIIAVMTTVLALFLIIVIYLTYFVIFVAPNIKNSTYNPRIWEKEENVLRGEIYDRSGTVLARSEQTKSGQKRIYPYGSLYAHTIGYNCRNYGKTNLELTFNEYLLKTKTSFKIKKDVENGEVKLEEGANLSLTLDNSMTELAAKQLGKNYGAVVAMSPKTGEVYCLYSNPSFDPNESSLMKNWQELTQSEDSPFFARATQGQYAPGSTFKVITASAGIASGDGDYITEDTGKTKVGGKEFKNASEKAFGEVDMRIAIKNSSNVYFTELSKMIGKENLQNTAKNFFVTQKVPFDIDTRATNLEFDSFDDAELASVAIGQGKLQVSPFNMAIAACAIANDGVIMKPYMVEKAAYDTGEVLYESQPEILMKATDRKTALLVRDYMKDCVKSGTGTRAAVRGIEVAGKTGTAENEKKGKTHAWFIGMAPADNPQIVVCVMQEYSGRGGGSACAPIASQIISYALKNGLITK